MFFDRGIYSTLIVRYQTPDPNRVMEGIGKVWRQMFPDAPFEGEFADEQLAELYRTDEARGQTFAAFALLAVIIASSSGCSASRPSLPSGVDEGDRHPQGVRRAQPRHRPAARMAVLEAGNHRQPDRLADRLVGHARLAERLDSRIDLDPARSFWRGYWRWRSRLVRSRAMRSVSRANPIHALRYE